MVSRKIPHLKIFGYSDDLIEVYDGTRHINEIDCLGYDAIIQFTDKTEIKVHYGKNNNTLGVWEITVLNQGFATQGLTVCNDKNAEIYSDIFEIEADIWSLDRVQENI